MKENVNESNLFNKAKDLHNKGVDGDDAAVKEAYKLFKQLKKSFPNNSVVEAYLGSTITLLGRNEAQDPMKRIEYAEKGLSMLDQLVNKYPTDQEIRSLRGFVCYKLPEDIFGRQNTAIEDFEFIVERHESNPSPDNHDLYQQVLFDLGCAYDEMGKQELARVTWIKLLRVTNDSRYKKKLQKKGISSP